MLTNLSWFPTPWQQQQQPLQQQQQSSKAPNTTAGESPLHAGTIGSANEAGGGSNPGSAADTSALESNTINNNSLPSTSTSSSTSVQQPARQTTAMGVAPPAITTAPSTVSTTATTTMISPMAASAAARLRQQQLEAEEDAMVKQMLTQFPVYGTASTAMPSSSSAVAMMEDSASGGGTNTSFLLASRTSQQQQQQASISKQSNQPLDWLFGGAPWNYSSKQQQQQQLPPPPPLSALLWPPGGADEDGPSLWKHAQWRQEHADSDDAREWLSIQQQQQAFREDPLFLGIPNNNGYHPNYSDSAAIATATNNSNHNHNNNMASTQNGPSRGDEDQDGDDEWDEDERTLWMSAATPTMATNTTIQVSTKGEILPSASTTGTWKRPALSTNNNINSKITTTRSTSRSAPLGPGGAVTAISPGPKATLNVHPNTQQQQQPQHNQWCMKAPRTERQLRREWLFAKLGEEDKGRRENQEFENDIHVNTSSAGLNMDQPPASATDPVIMEVEAAAAPVVTQSLAVAPGTIMTRYQPPLTSSLLATQLLLRDRHTGPPTAAAATPANRSAATLGENRQHWMPDQLCKQCYACDVPFTVFRRRHHCRLCGQVFCNSCSAFFVPAVQQPSTAAIQATAVQSLLTPQHQQQQPYLPNYLNSLGQQQSQLQLSPTPFISSLSTTAATPTASLSTTDSSSVAGTATATINSYPFSPRLPVTLTTTTIRVCKMCYDQVMKNGGGVIVDLYRGNPSTHAVAPNMATLTHGRSLLSADGILLPSNLAHNNMRGSAEYSYWNCKDGNSETAKDKQNLVTATGDEPDNPHQQCHGQDGAPTAPEGQTLCHHASSGSEPVVEIHRVTFPPPIGTMRGHPNHSSHHHGHPPNHPHQQRRRPSLASSSIATSTVLSTATPSGADGCAGRRVSATTSTYMDPVSNKVTALAMVLAADGPLGMQYAARDQAALLQEGNRHMGWMAAQHLERLAQALLKSHAPLLWNAIAGQPHQQAAWIHQLLSLATRCCATVNPNVKKGDRLDIRPYCKVKVIAGGSHQNCVYLSGVLFRKTVSHKRMARCMERPRILLLAGGIEFTRTENRIASLETLFDAEATYMEILVGKILKLKPDLVLVGRSVSRKAHELLLKADVVLIQHVKTSLMNRIARQTGATIISSTDHVMNQFGSTVLGECRRFRLATFRDNEAWADERNSNGIATNKNIHIATSSNGKPSHFVITTDRPENPDTSAVDDVELDPSTDRPPRSIVGLLSDPTVPHHERQAALAARQLGQDVLDGVQAIKSGLAKRGVVQTYVMLEGCPKELGCTVVLRGARRAALKQVKAVFRFLVNVAYNLRLETSYLKERGGRIRDDYHVLPQHTFSSSLCVDYGSPPNGRKVRPWNGGNGNEAGGNGSGHKEKSLSVTDEITAFDHQSILITSVWMADKSQCCPAEVKGICYYSMQDVALGQFLRDSCFNVSLKCQNPNCKKSVLDHSLSFVHNDGLLNIMVVEMDEALPPSPLEERSEEDDDGASDNNDAESDKPIATWTYCKNCRKVVTSIVYISENTWKFSFGKFLEVFFYNRDAILNAPDHQCYCQLQSSAILYFGCGNLSARFTYEKIAPFHVYVRKNLPLDEAFHKKDAMYRLSLISTASSALFVKFDKHIEKVSREARSLFNTPVIRPEYLQTVLLELNRIGSEVDHASKTLQEKIASVSFDSDSGKVNEALLRFPWFARRYLFMLTSAWNEKLKAAGQALSSMKKIAAALIHRHDAVNVAAVVGDPVNEELMDAMKRIRQLNDQYSRYNIIDITEVLPIHLGGNDVPHDNEFDDEFDDPESCIDFTEGVDADVLASRRRLKNSANKTATSRPSKALGTRRSLTDVPRPSVNDAIDAPAKPTAGGAVKSAITRFFNRGGRDPDPYVVNLGVFAEGRPRLAPGVNGIVIPVMDDRHSTIIAYSLASAEYAKQLKQLFRAEDVVVSEGDGPSPSGFKETDGREFDGRSSRIGSSEPTRERSNLSPLSPTSPSNPSRGGSEIKNIERHMLVRNKSLIKHIFRDYDEKGQVTCKFVCTTYWATQFHAVRQIFLSPHPGRAEDGDPSLQPSLDVEQSYVESLSSAYSWAASGGKSGASFARTSDDRFVIKCISRTELQMFLDCAPAYFEYLTKAFFHGLPTVLCKIVGVYQIGVHNRVTGKRSMEQVAVMQNIFYNRKITRIFDLKGSLRGRYASEIRTAKEDGGQSEAPMGGADKSALKRRTSDAWSEDPSSGRQSDYSLAEESEPETASEAPTESEPGPKTLLDGDFLAFTNGRPLPLTDRAKAVFQMSILNDTLFLSIINVLDYSILVGVDEDKMELIVGIIDFMRQYDILKQMERVGKSLPMVVGSEAPTIIQPPLYKARFTNAMEKYFMTVPSKWTVI